MKREREKEGDDKISMNFKENLVVRIFFSLWNYLKSLNFRLYVILEK